MVSVPCKKKKKNHILFHPPVHAQISTQLLFLQPSSEESFLLWKTYLVKSLVDL